ncbi:MAG: hypothetical protein ACRDNM_00110 [Gaiellaceae bacterium]
MLVEGRAGEHGGPCKAVELIGRRTWREIATEFEGRELVTPCNQQSLPIRFVPLRCEIDASLDQGDESEVISTDEARAILDTLAESGQRELAERIAPVLERCTRTDPPPAPRRPTPTEPMKAAKP